MSATVDARTDPDGEAGTVSDDPLGMQMCSSCEGKGSIVQYKTDAHGNETPTHEPCGACGGNGFVQGQSR
jgi:DnaJ-class molecular chaperone